VGVGDFGGTDFERLLGETRRALGALGSGARTGGEAGGDAGPGAGPGRGTGPGAGPGLGAGPGAGAGADAEPVSGEGSAADGKITAKVAAGGHLEELTVDPRLLRSGSEDLCAQIKIAVNAAMDDLRARTAQAGPATMDPAALAGMLEELQTESVRQMSQFTQGVAETVAKINAATRGERRG
jgi:DNA-binding protein YbaB